jgi:hypothetical protein
MLAPPLACTNVTLRYDLGPILQAFRDFAFHEIDELFSSFLPIPELPKFHPRQSTTLNTPRSNGPTSASGSNSDGAFDVIATLYCRKNDKHRTPSNVVSQDVAFPTTECSSILRRSMMPRVIMNSIVQPPYRRRKTDV